MNWSALIILHCTQYGHKTCILFVRPQLGHSHNSTTSFKALPAICLWRFFMCEVFFFGTARSTESHSSCRKDERPIAAKAGYRRAREGRFGSGSIRRFGLRVGVAKGWRSWRRGDEADQRSAIVMPGDPKRMKIDNSIGISLCVGRIELEFLPACEWRSHVLSDARCAKPSSPFPFPAAVQVSTRMRP